MPQISVDVAWSPYGIDGRNYGVLGLATAADLLFVMAYDMQSQVRRRTHGLMLVVCVFDRALHAILHELQSTGLHAACAGRPWQPARGSSMSAWHALPRLRGGSKAGASMQIWGRCVASANSPLALVRRGVQQYLDLGVPASKLVLGLPWCVSRHVGAALRLDVITCSNTACVAAMVKVKQHVPEPAKTLALCPKSALFVLSKENRFPLEPPEPSAPADAWAMR